MKIKSNGLVKLMVPLAILGTVFIGVKSCSTDGGEKNAQANAGTAVPDLTPEDMKAMGIEGDTPQDTLRTLVGSLKTVTKRQNQLDADNKALAEENKNLQQSNQNVDERIHQAVINAQSTADKEQSHLKGQVQALTTQIGDLMQKLKDKGNGGQGTMTGNPSTIGSDIPVGLGLDGGGVGSAVPSTGSDGLLWVEPKDGVAVDASGKPVGEGNTNIANGFSFATSFLDDNAITRQKAELANKTNAGKTLSGNNAAEGPVDPVYTLPENSTLIGSRAMTALLGRVPIDGKVTDPYPFKVLIGKDNLTANGIDLPDVQGAIVSGTATGDWTLSCVRGSVTSITFVFSDGTVRTLPRPAGQTDSQGGNNGNNAGSIGWLSDENGIPCLSGERKSNASTYLPTLFALSASSAAGDALAQNQNTAQTNAYGGVTSTLTGDAGQSVLGKAVSGGMRDMADWVKARYGQTFDAIYVPPGMKVAVHITRQLAIDYEEKGRKVKYDFSLSQAGTGLD
ncbi:TIGR03752 family integrating conjugative element protein [Prodigiosinella confusarubida]|uniref:TIGR03752 family integrating conjugative element protein n=1 Tax=Serratia sp. (strain ATCC 39006) TaxID=104623 RepID=A0A2I5TBH1_SERS3|nr:TIGR03752 family integrating conjugative element protein [Serratia sp. ATCC 39006]AUH01882.1 TIGR03752 family integrating conjugative element protein [Serratia sp. ATCC 39006]AUH06204.1 TIGR03752 family integrating conjugative element protein [Serratia sp. ATCC 39006]